MHARVAGRSKSVRIGASEVSASRGGSADGMVDLFKTCSIEEP